MISRIAKIDNIKYGFLKYTLYRLYEMKTRLIILAVCGLLSFPLLAVAGVITASDNSNTMASVGNSIMFFALISVMLACLSGFLVFLITYTGGVNCYDYYNRREKVDLSWSLPLTNRQRFWGDFASGLGPIVITYIISGITGLLIAGIGVDTEQLGAVTIPVIASAMFAGLLALIALFIIGVFCAALCGRVFESVIYPALICGVIPALIGLIGSMVFLGVWQVQIYQQLNTVLAATSPFGFFGVFIVELTNNIWRVGSDGSIAEHIIFLKPAVMIPFVLVHGGFLAGAYYLGKKRGAENTGKPFVFKAAAEIILSLVIFCIVAVFCFVAANDDTLTGGTIFGMFTCTIIAFLMLDVSTKRGFKRMGRAFFRYVVMFTGAVIVSNILLAANGFGAGSYVPAENRIQSVSINVNYMDSIQIEGWGGNMWRTPIPQAQFTDPDVIGLIRRLHQESNDNPHNDDIWINMNNPRMMFYDSYWHGGYGNTGWHWNHLQVTYALKSGGTISRNVRLNDVQTAELLELITHDEFKQNRLDFIDGWFEGKDNVQSSAWVTSLSQERVSHGNGFTNGERILEAFRKDYIAETFNQRFRSVQTVQGKLLLHFAEMALMPDGRSYTGISSMNLSIYILPHYTNLIAELERQGFDVWNGVNDDIFQMSHFSVSYAGYIAANSRTAQQAEWSWMSIRRDETTSDLLDVLLAVVQPSYFVNDEGYFLTISGNSGTFIYVVPPEFNHIAEELETIIIEQYAEGHDEWWYHDFYVPDYDYGDAYDDYYDYDYDYDDGYSQGITPLRVF